jgi:UDP-glucuronate decarboxylase
MKEKYYLQSDIAEITKNLEKHLKNFSGKKFLISGANGFLGKYFIKTLINLNKKLKKKASIVAIDIKFDKCEIYSDKNVKKIKQDINNIRKINFKSDYVLHAAGIPSPKHYFKKPIEAIFTSITGTKKLLEYSKKNKSKFIFFSSSEIYGNPDKKNIPTKETYNGNVSSIEDRSCYDEGKRVGETLCYFYKIKEKVNCAIFRPFNVFGPGMPKSDYRVFPRFFNSIKKNNQ